MPIMEGMIHSDTDFSGSNTLYGSFVSFVSFVSFAALLFVASVSNFHFIS